jgi:hypothetical protein
MRRADLRLNNGKTPAMAKLDTSATATRRRHRLMSVAVLQFVAVQGFAENLEALLVAIKPRHHCVSRRWQCRFHRDLVLNSNK